MCSSLLLVALSVLQVVKLIEAFSGQEICSFVSPTALELNVKMMLLLFAMVWTLKDFLELCQVTCVRLLDF